MYFRSVALAFFLLWTCGTGAQDTYPDEVGRKPRGPEVPIHKDFGSGAKATAAKPLKGPKNAKEAVDAAMRADDAEAKSAAGAVRDFGDEALPILLEIINSKDEARRLRAADVLLSAYSLTPESANAFALLLDFPNEEIRVRAVEKLSHSNPDITDARVAGMAKALGDTAPAVRLQAAKGLRFLPDNSARPIVPVLTKALGDENEEVRAYAAQALGKVGLSALPAEKDLLALLGDPSEDVRRGVLAAFKGIGEPAVPGLVGALGDPRPAARAAAAEALGRGCGCSDAAVPALVNALKDPDPAVQKAAAMSLSAYGNLGQEAIQALQQTAKDAPPEARSKVLGLLANANRRGGQSPDGHSVELILNALDDPDPKLRAETLGSLSRIVRNTPELFSKACNLLQEDADPGVRAAAAGCVGNAGEQFPNVASDLVAAAKDPALEVRVSAVRALAALGPGAKEAVPVLVELLNPSEFGKKDGEEGKMQDALQAAAIGALDAIGPQAKDAVPRLIEFLKAMSAEPPSNGGFPRSRFPRSAVFSALKGISYNATAAIPELIKLMESQDEELQLMAVDTISVLGPDAKTAIPILERFVKDKERPSLSKMALDALWRVSPADAEKYGNPTPQPGRI